MAAARLCVVRSERGLAMRVLDGCTLEVHAAPVELQQVWDRLASVGRLDATVLADVLAVLEQTVDGFDRTNAPLLLTHDAPRPRATAAHPRAYRGTRTQPPTPAAPALQDLRAVLSNPGALQRLLTHLGAEPPPPATDRRLPHGVRFDLLPAHGDPSDARRLGSLHDRLALDDPSRRGMACAVLLQPSGIHWLEALALVSERDRATLFPALARSTPAFPVTDLVHLAGIDAQALLLFWDVPDAAWIEVGLTHAWTPHEPWSGAFDRGRFEAHAARLPETWAGRGLWSACASRIGLLEALGSTDLDDERHTGLVGMLTSWLDPGGWEALRPLLPMLIGRAARVADVHRWTRLVSSELVLDALDRLPVILTICERLSALGAAQQGHWWLGGLPAVVLEALAALDVSMLRGLDQRLVRKNTAVRAGMGLASLAHQDPTLVIEALTTCPGRLLQACAALGCFDEKHREQVVRLGALRLPDDLRTRVEAIEALGLRYDPVSKALRSHLRGTHLLRTGQLARAADRLWASTPDVRLQHLLQTAERQAAVGLQLGERTQRLDHAIWLLRDVPSRSRRSFRRLLQAVASGDPGWSARHPANVAWAERHPELDLAIWTGPTAGAISIEADPLEVLMAGTHIGTCLGLGGMVSDNAVALALDLNKQVVYLRRGSEVVARMVLGYAEEGIVVCHQPYPLGLDAEHTAALATWVVGFCERLGRPLSRDDCQPYTLARLVGDDVWWDDGAWFDAPFASTSTPRTE